VSAPLPDSEVTQDLPERRCFVVCGDDTLTYRLADELLHRHSGQVTVIMRSRERGYGPRIAKLAGVRIVEVDRPDAEAYAEADLANADALALLGRDDIANIDAALLAHEINPRLPLVVRMFNTGLGEGVAQLPYCSVLSDTAMAAPAFVAAAMGESASAVRLRNGTLLIADRGTVPEADIVCGLASTEGRDAPELLPADQHAADVVLARARHAGPPAERRTARLTHHYPIRAVVRRVWRRVRLIFGVYGGLLFVGAAITATVREDIGPWQAVYLSLIDTLGGIGADLKASTVEQVTQTVLATASIALIPLLTATVVDAVVKSRLELAEGSLINRASGHVVVVGLGGVGSHVVKALHEQGVDVVAVDRSTESRGAQVVKDLHVPLIIGDGSRRETLLTASVGTARAVMALTPDDATNLETALTARAIQPDIPVVLRLFDGDFASRIQRAFNITVSHSVSYLAAPSFAACMLGEETDTIPIGRHVLLVADLTLGTHCVIEGQKVGDVRRPHEAWVIEVTNAHGQRLPPAVAGGRRLQHGDTLLVVGTRRGLARLIAETTTQPDSAPRTPIVVHDAPSFGTPPGPRRPD
jgi:Trk K+ transport system NAD-binding subunit